MRYKLTLGIHGVVKAPDIVGLYDLTWLLWVPLGDKLIRVMVLEEYLFMVELVSSLGRD